jgi:hypothetical protein
MLTIIPVFAYSQKNEILLPSGLVIAPADENGIFTWEEAKKKCESKGAGWALPTKEELTVMYENKEVITNITSSWYWSLSQDESCHYNDFLPNSGYAWNMMFDNGILVSNLKTYKIKARCVKHK